ncbi:hypothetical protein [Botryobacter ruber]|uniref:hypothetical protein n=1 Tax=Botryobacter ruber TaxID=2171629 RepID=UPI000E0A0AD4|nr:hypothetical protein [Botryobacter ruber]
MKQLSFLCIICLFLVANTCKERKLEKKLLQKTWLHSFEEDADDILVYRPNTYDFPPSRGRTGFSLEPNGVVKEYVIAPTDGLEEHEGRWEHADHKLLHIHFNPKDKIMKDYSLEIVELEDDVLKVKKNTETIH